MASKGETRREATNAPKAAPAKGKTTSTLRGGPPPALNAAAAPAKPNWQVANEEANHHISDEELARAKAAFFQVDSDGSGSIDKEELGQMLKNLGQSPTEEELQAMIDEADGGGLNTGESSDRNGKIEMREFLKWYAKICNSARDTEEEDIMDVFRALGGSDVTKDTVSKDAVKKLLAADYELGSEQAAELSLFDTIPGDKVSYEQFKKVMEATSS